MVPSTEVLSASEKETHKVAAQMCNTRWEKASSPGHETFLFYSGTQSTITLALLQCSKFDRSPMTVRNPFFFPGILKADLQGAV